MKTKDKRLFVFLFVSMFIIAFAILFVNFIIIGKVVDEFGPESIGPTDEEQRCMEECVAVGCESGDEACMTANSEKCMVECGAGSGAQSEGEQCVQDCINKFCESGPNYVGCMEQYRDSCDDECGMKGDAPDESEMSAEQLCISNCVYKVDPTIICGSSQEGETGNEVCQRCADECVHLYEGPCLDDEELSKKEKACETCEHCYGEPVMGDSGQGWECIVDVECKDASGEFGDEPGTGPGIGDEGYVPENIVEEVADTIVGFFKGLFN